MAAKKRQDRVAEEIKKELSRIIRDDVNDPGMAPMVSIIRVELAKDLGYAKVFLSVIGSDEQVEKTRRALKRAAGYIRRELGRVIKIHHVPELKFIIDDSIEQSVRISKTLRELNIKPEIEGDDNDE